LLLISAQASVLPADLTGQITAAIRDTVGVHQRVG
jgi:hypothetical protein